MDQNPNNSSSVTNCSADETPQQVCGYKNIDDLSQAVLKSVMGAVRSSNDLPIAGDDLDFCSSFSSYQQFLGIQGTRLLQLIQTAMRYHGIRGSIAANNELTDVEDRFDVLVDANDQLLERVGTMLDEISGLRKKETSLVVVTKTPKQTAASGGWNKKVTPVSSAGKYRLLTARNIRRPQAQFKDKIDNSDRPFVPKITVKPNAVKSLADSLQCNIPDEVDSSFCYPHPYQFELDNHVPDPSWLEKCKPIIPPPIETTSLTLVDTEEELNKLCPILKTQSEFAVDLEAHSYRSYQGFTCLIQISTRDHDYIIDALALRDHLHVLNESFTNPKILKVLHGADQDVLWLQRDFGVYLVGLFDTHQASRSMAFQRHRLQELLWHYCNVEANKEYQLEDWRIRPLPEDFLLYARMDTHYLLYVYDCLKNDLLHRSNEQKNILMSVFQRSTQICLKRYMKPQLKIENYKDLLVTHRKKFNPQQMAALKGLFVWRDGIARQVDESTGFVLPNLMMVQIAELLPREPEGILACCSNIPPLVQEYLMELHLIIKDAREARLVKKEEPKVEQLTILTPTSMNIKLQYCPYDLSHNSDSGDVQTIHRNDDLLDVRSKLFEDNIAEVQMKTSPILLALLPNLSVARKKKARRRAENVRKLFVNPFLKYLPLSAVDGNAHPNRISTPEEPLWKLLPHTTKRGATASQSRVAEVLKTAALITFEQNEAIEKGASEKETVVTVRHQLSNERQQHSSSEASTGVVGKKRKLKQDKSEVDATASDFVAHDYSKVDYKKMLQVDDSNKSTTKKDKKKKRDFDPSSSLAEPDIQGVPRKRPLMYTPSNKNLSYGKNIESRPQMPKIAWPKR